MTDQLVQEIYIQLLELYTKQLEGENSILDLTVKAHELMKDYKPPQPPLVTPWQDDRWPRYPNWYTYSDTTTTVKPYPYSEKYDAYYNEETNQWLESRCDDPTCEFCVDRPTRPLP